MKSNSEYKNQAVEVLTGNWGIAAVMTLVFLLIYQSPTLISYKTILSDFPSGDTLTFSSGSYLSDIIMVLLLPLTYGYTITFLKVFRTKKIEFASLFDGFKIYGRALGTLLLMSLYTILWAILFVIPGIIKAYSYSQTLFILHDNPDLSYNAAIEKSMEMMQGQKMKLFLLDLSMIGWFILSCLTLGIGFFFLYPYFMTSHAAFYEDLKKERYGSIEIIEE